ncbi:MAG TPA: hypothetical protein VMF52_10975 [Steroidobacteraceae bacterium]|nr:hypothetical protein [Steroidobacteraceae bacterium]
MNAVVKTSREKRHDFLIQQRDKHLSQFMEINGKAVFAALTAIFGVLVAVGNVQGKFQSANMLAVGLMAAVAATGIIFLFVGGYLLSNFHTRAIRSIQVRLAKKALRRRSRPCGSPTRDPSGD